MPQCYAQKVLVFCIFCVTLATAWTDKNVAHPRRERTSSNIVDSALSVRSGVVDTADGQKFHAGLNRMKNVIMGRRKAIFSPSAAAIITIIGSFASTPASPSWAYTPDSDPQRESLYLISRVQEATVQQERFVNRAVRQEDLKSKMKLTLRLVEKNYRLLDQINFLSNYVEPPDEIVAATEAGVEAVEALQNAIDYAREELKNGPFEDGQKEYLTDNLRTCREKLFVFMRYVPKGKLEEARMRVEEENVANREEYGGDGTEGVYDPVILPWKLE